MIDYNLMLYIGIALIVFGFVLFLIYGWSFISFS